MGDKDKSYKLLFSHAQMVEELLRDFVREDWFLLCFNWNVNRHPKMSAK